MPSPQCDITPSFQLKCMFRRERHNLSSGCTYRTIHVDGPTDLLHLQAEMHGLETYSHSREKVHPHCHAALPSRYVKSNVHVHHCEVQTVLLYYIRKAMHNPLPWNPSRHTGRDPGQIVCDASCAAGSSVYATMCSKIVKSYALYIMRISKQARSRIVGVHS